MSIRDEVRTLEHVIQVMGPGDEQAGIISYDQVIDQYDPAGLDSGRQIAPDDIAAMFHTGGTTGSPKLALQTHWNQVFLAWALTASAGVTVHDVLLCGLPLFHANGVFVTGLAPFSVGAQVVLLSPQGYRDQGVIRNFYKIVEHFGATTFSGVPTLYAALLQVPVGDADVSSLRFAICGAAPMPVELFRAYEDYTGLDIMEGYGLTEGTCVSSANPKDGESRIGSIGIRLIYQEMKTVVVDAEGKYVRDCAVGEIGVVAIKGPNVFEGYLEEEHNRDAWVAEGWLNTGDLGRVDEDGYFWLTGRTKELIIRSGHNIDPAAIEGPLYDHPAIELAAAVGKPDSYAGELPVAYVALKDEATATAEELLDHASAHIGERAAVPKEIYILDQMPVTAVGKIFKPELRWDAIRRVYTNELFALDELVAHVDVTVKEDKVHGTLVHITVRSAEGVSKEKVEERVKEILGQYTIAYKLEWT
jgi:fatty-acyl-CoA synthase